MQQDRRRPSPASQSFTRTEDDCVLEIECTTCNRLIQFSKFARPEELERAMLQHYCLKPALVVNFEMLELVRCPMCAGASCASCQHGTVLVPRVKAKGVGL